MNFSQKLLWVYIVLLLVGGLVGFFKGKSPVSLVMSAIFAALLALCATGIIFQYYMANVFMAVLLVVFAIRLAKTKKFMPSGLMVVITLAAILLRNFRF